MPLPQLGINEHVRVCDGCYIKLKLEKASVAASSSTPIPKSTTSNTAHPNATRSTTTASTANNNSYEFDDDMKKAIELSLKEAEQQNTGYGNGYVAPVAKQVVVEEPVKANETLEDDPDLAAAIAASLRDMEISNSSSSGGAYQSQQQQQLLNKNELSPVEMENILLFSTLMDRVYAQGGDISNDQQINQLYTQIGTLQPKLVKNLDEIIRKRNAFIELHEKLNMAVKAYDRLLEERISNVRLSNSNIPEQQYQHQPLYHQQQQLYSVPSYNQQSYYQEQQQQQEYSAPPHQDIYYPPATTAEHQATTTYYPPQPQQLNNQDMSHYYSAPPAQHYPPPSHQEEQKKPVVDEAPLIDL